MELIPSHLIKDLTLGDRAQDLELRDYIPSLIHCSEITKCEHRNIGNLSTGNI